MKAPLTKARVDKFTVEPGAAPILVWDTTLAGFGLKVSPNAKTYVVQYRVGKGRRFASKRMAIGRHGTITPDEARAMAKDLLADVTKGQNPAQARSEARKAMTFAEWAPLYLEQHARLHKKPRTVMEDERNLNLHLTPEFGRKALAEITVADVKRFHAKAARPDENGRTRKTNANRCLSLLSHMYTIAADQDPALKGYNPTIGVPRYAEVKRKRYLGSDELARVGQALVAAQADVTARREAPPPPRRGKTDAARAQARELGEARVRSSLYMADVIRLLILTGARLSEIATLQWAWVDFERAELRLPDSKTGAKEIPLAPPALAVLQGLPRLQGCPYVFPATNGKGPLGSGIQKFWQSIREAAGIEGVHIHDLRHSFASVAAAHGASLPLIGALLGHANASTTQRYAHIAASPVRVVADTTANHIAALLSPSPAAPGGDGPAPAANVVPLARSR